MDPSSIFLATTFTRKMPKSSDSMHSSYFMLENIWHHHFTWSGPNSQEIVNLVPVVGSRGPQLDWNKFTISCELDPLQVKWWHHILSSINREEYMETELSGIFWVEMVTKNIVLGSPGTHFIPMRVKIKMIPSLVTCIRSWHIFIWMLRTVMYQFAEAHPGPSQPPKINIFVGIVNVFRLTLL